VHLALPKVGNMAVVLYARSDGRLFFVVPWNGFSLLGTTDTDYRGDLDRIVTDPEDARYLLAEARFAYPEAPWETIYFTWAGVRSLMHIEGVPESDVSRRHILYDHGVKDGVPGLLSIIGGKLTAYRSVAEDLVDAACRILGQPSRGRTAELPLPGGMLRDIDRFVAVHRDQQAQQLGVDATLVEHLMRVYGSRYARVLQYVRANRELLAPLGTRYPDVMAQVLYAVDEEDARTLADVVLRRLTIGLSAERGRDVAEPVADILAQHLQWDDHRKRQELAAFEDQLALGATPPLAHASSQRAGVSV
jgi:glycerol-3-phosphate dehydrogenase